MRLLGARAAKTAGALLVVVVLAGCTGSQQLSGTEPQRDAAPPPPPRLSPPPVDLAGRWKLTAASGGGCFMVFGASSGAAQGTVAPEGGCPGNFYTSRKWTFEHNELVIRNHKGEPLAQLAFAGGHFQGHGTGGIALSLSR